MSQTIYAETLWFFPIPLCYWRYPKHDAYKIAVRNRDGLRWRKQSGARRVAGADFGKFFDAAELDGDRVEGDGRLHRAPGELPCLLHRLGGRAGENRAQRTALAVTDRAVDTGPVRQRALDCAMQAFAEGFGVMYHQASVAVGEGFEQVFIPSLGECNRQEVGRHGRIEPDRRRLRRRARILVGSRLQAEFAQRQAAFQDCLRRVQVKRGRALIIFAWHVWFLKKWKDRGANLTDIRSRNW